MNTKSDQSKEVLETERKWVAAHQSLDIEMIGNILGENYRQIRADGSVIGKDELLASYSSRKRSWEIAQGDEYEVRIIGDVALLIGRWRGRGMNSGKRFDYSARFLAVYQKVKGNWKLISDVSVPLQG